MERIIGSCWDSRQILSEKIEIFSLFLHSTISIRAKVHDYSALYIYIHLSLYTEGQQEYIQVRDKSPRVQIVESTKLVVSIKV